MEVGGFKIGKLPLPRIWDERAAELSDYSEQMLSLNKKVLAVKTDHERNLVQRQINAVDEQIDNLVYELYGLTKEEIRIVEGAPDDSK
jgi:predicted  nucleic acid-binding Zn-ribbon protein